MQGPLAAISFALIGQLPVALLTGAMGSPVAWFSAAVASAAGTWTINRFNSGMTNDLGVELAQTGRSAAIDHAIAEANEIDSLDRDLLQATTSESSVVQEAGVNSIRLFALDLSQMISTLIVPPLLAVLTGGASILASLSLVAAAVAPSVCGTVYGYARSRREESLTSTVHKTQSSFLDTVQRLLSTDVLTYLKFLGAGRDVTNSSHDSNAERSSFELQLKNFRLRTGMRVDALTMVGVLLPIALCVFGVIHGAAVLGPVVGLALAFGGPARRIVSTFSVLQEMSGVRRSWDKFFDRRAHDQDRPFAREIPTGRTITRVIFENVSYSSRGTSILSGVDADLSLRPSDAIALASESGTGKTTFIKLFTGQVRLTSGRITYVFDDGSKADAADLKAESIWRQFALGRQIHEIGRMRVGEVLRLGDPHATATSILGRLSGVGWNLHPDQLAKLCKRRLQDLSGGQQQSIIDVMVLTSKRPIHIIDEPTTGMSSGAVRATMRTLAHHPKPVIFSSHNSRWIYEHGFQVVNFGPTIEPNKGFTVTGSARDARLAGASSDFVLSVVDDGVATPQMPWPQAWEVRDRTIERQGELLTVLRVPEGKRLDRRSGFTYRGPVYSAQQLADAIDSARTAMRLDHDRRGLGVRTGDSTYHPAGSDRVATLLREQYLDCRVIVTDESSEFGDYLRSTLSAQDKARGPAPMLA